MQRNNYPLELLAPAKDLDCGMAAINHGADAVYIGAPNFGARKSASNTISDIEKLVRHAHLYGAKVYVALNTLLFDHEIPAAVSLAEEIHNAGADALIIQDLGLLEAALPPIAIHASTQMDNRTPHRVLFLEETGFEQVVLARELSLEQIAAISAQTNVKLEFFIHGALCVSYSGQCYMSQSINKRSANRGECGQPCRLKYNLTDAQGNTLMRDKHLLSLKDFNLSDRLEALIDAGISSFKIEGRLKDKDYVANITAFYRSKLDAILAKRPELSRLSSGKSTFDFKPDPQKSFNRDFTTYFIDGRQKEIWSVDTPKATGEKMGKVMILERNRFKLDRHHDIVNGDGLCYFDRKNQLKGLKVNKSEDGYIYPLNMDGLYAGATIFRNYNHLFNNLFKKETAQRRIAIEMVFEEGDEKMFCLTITDEDGITTQTSAPLNAEEPKNVEMAMDQIKKQLAKTGNTPFMVKEPILSLKNGWFIPAAELNALRREALEKHQEERISSNQPKDVVIAPTSHPYPAPTILKEGNVINQWAAKFFGRHGSEVKELGFERQMNYNGEVVMTTKHCILNEQDKCLKLNPAFKKQLPLFIENDKDRYELQFDCKACEMKVIRR